MTFIRGHRSRFDRWQELGNPGWGYDDVLPLFKRSETQRERRVGVSRRRRSAGGVGLHGPSRRRIARSWPRPWQNGFKADARFDFNQPATNNVAGYYQKNILDGKRHSAADAFLVPALSRPNLDGPLAGAGARADRRRPRGGRRIPARRPAPRSRARRAR